MYKTLGRYQILGELGSGGQSVVYRAWDPLIHRPVAIKQVKAAAELSAQKREVFLRRFFQETKVAGSLGHPHIASIYDVGSDDSGPYLVMELIDGPSLSQILSGGRPLSEAATVRLILEVCEGLSYAHDHAVIHRDIKPANLLIDRTTGRVKLLDFGIARVSSSELTQTGELLGTINYMSPEQIKGEKVDRKTDIFSLGIVLYQCLTGELPFVDDNPTTVIFKIVHDPYPPLDQIDSRLAGRFSSIVKRALTKDPSKRYSNCRELAEDLRKLKIPGAEQGLGDLIDLPAVKKIDPDTTATLVPAAGPDTEPTVQVAAESPKSRRWLWTIGGLVMAAFLLATWVLMPGQETSIPVSSAVAPEENLLAQAEEAFAAGRLVGDASDDALSLARTALALGSEAAQDLIDSVSQQVSEQTRSQAASVSPREAAQIYAEYLKYFPEDSEMESLRVQAEQAGSEAEARARLRDLTVRGQEALAADNVEAALSFFQQALQIDPTNAPVQYLTGRLMLRKGDPKNALKFFSGAAELEPLNPTYLLELSEVQTSLEQYEAAHDSLTRALGVGGDSLLGEKAARTRLQSSAFRSSLAKLTPFEIETRHDHFVGNCSGALRVEVKRLAFSAPENQDHSFSTDWDQVRTFELRGKKLSIEVSGRRYEFQGIESPRIQEIATLFKQRNE